MAAFATLSRAQCALGVLFAMPAAIGLVAEHRAATAGGSALPELDRFVLRHRAGAAASVNLAVGAAAIRDFVASAHDELKPITFPALVAADVDATAVADDFQITPAALITL